MSRVLLKGIDPRLKSCGWPESTGERVISCMIQKDADKQEIRFLQDGLG